MQIIQPLLLAAICFLASFFLAPQFVKLCIHLNLLDKANHRSSHTETTPRGGGLLIVCVFYAGFAFASFFSYFNLHPNSFDYLLLLFALPVAIIGFLDDRFSVSPIKRLVLHILVTAIPLFIYQRHHLNLHGIILTTILAFAWAWFLNLYNFMDGTDGYASMEGITIAIGILLITDLFSNEMAILIGVLLGFLRVGGGREI